MCLELPLAAWALAKFPNPEISLSAFGALLIAICYFFQSTTWNFIGTSAALVRSKQDLKIMIQFLTLVCLVMGLCYVGLVFGPLSKTVLIPLFGATNELFTLTIPSFAMAASWPCLVGYRRVNQGVLIHVSKSKLVSITSIIRIIGLALSIVVALALRPNFSGLTIVSMCMTFSVLVETASSHFFVVKFALPKLSDRQTTLTLKSIWDYSMPMMLAAIVSQIMMPLGSVILFRLPQSQFSLVVWPAVSGLLQLLRTIGFSLLELVASCGDNSKNRATILKYSNRFSILIFFFLLLLILTGIGKSYFSFFGGLEQDYANFASLTLAFGILYPSIEMRLWYLTGIAYATKNTKFTAQATFVAVALGLALYPIGLNQTFFSGAAFLLILLTICTIAEILVFTNRMAAKSVN